MGDREELLARARENAEGGADVPADWGGLIALEVGEDFVGRHRGHDEGGKGSGAWLVWDETGSPAFFWGCYRLDREYERESPEVGATVAIFRRENYQTRYDDPGEKTGLSYGLATEPNDAPLPAEWTDDNGVPF